MEWLNTGTGEIIPVAEDRKVFQKALGGNGVDEWFMPGLVQALHEAGMRPGAGECFTYAVYPVFAEGKYEISNFAVVPPRSISACQATFTEKSFMYRTEMRFT
jgi:hypothetical protein